MSELDQDQILAFIRAATRRPRSSRAEDIFGLGFVNSLFAMELVMFVEKTFGVTIPNDELRIDNFQTAAVMAELVDRLAPARPARGLTMTTLVSTAAPRERGGAATGPRPGPSSTSTSPRTPTTSSGPAACPEELLERMAQAAAVGAVPAAGARWARHWTW